MIYNKIGIEIQEESIQYLDIPKKYGYELVDNIRLEGKILIHMYPTKDTIKDTRGPWGLKHVLFFDVKLFNPKDKEYMVSKRHDMIDYSTDGVSVERLEIHKDGSTLAVVHFDGKHELNKFLMLDFCKIKED